MRKMLMTVVAMLASVVSFAAQNDKLIMFSTPGSDMYADGSAVKDGECYALVWVKDGSEFAGFKANGALVDEVNNQLIYVAELAKDGCCPNVMFEIDADKAEALKGGSYIIFILDTRDAAGNVQGVTAEGQAKAIRCYGEAAVVDSQAMICTAVSRKLVLASVAPQMTVADLREAIAAGQTVNEGVINVDSDTIGYITAIDLGGKTHGATLEVTGNGILQVSNGSINIKAQARAVIPNMGEFWLGSLGLVEAVAQNAEQLGVSTDNAEVFLTEDYVGYPQAWTDYKVGAAIPENFRDKVDIAYSFYAMNPAVDPELGVSDWELYYENAATTPAQEARLEEIQAQLAPFVQNKSDQDRWHADFVVYFDKPVAEGSVELSGCYGTWLDGTVLTYALDKDMAAGDKYRLLRDKASIFYSYNEILKNVKEFGCGVKNLSNANVGTKMTVELRIFRGVSGHVENDEPLSILIGSYEYVLRGSEIATSIASDAVIADEVKAVALGNKAVDSFKQSGIGAYIGETAQFGYIGMALTQAELNANGVVEAMAFDATANKVIGGEVSAVNVGGSLMVRMPIDNRTALTQANVYCDGDFIGRYPVQALVISSQAPLSDPTRKPEGMEGLSWEECSPVDSVTYTFVEFPASEFPASYSYVLFDTAKEYTITYTSTSTAVGTVTLPSTPASYNLSDSIKTLNKATCTAENFTFGGWLLNGKNIGTAIPANAAGNLTLVAKWEELATTVPIYVTKESEATPTMPIKVTKAWVEENVTGGMTAATPEKIEEELNKPDPNGNLKWVNYVMGQDPSAKIVAESTANSSVDKINVVPAINPPAVDTGFEVSYSIDQVKVAAASGEAFNVVAEGTETVKENLNINLAADLANKDSALYKVNVIITATDEQGNKQKFVSSNTVGVLKPETDKKLEMVAVPWDAITTAGNSEAISVADIVKTESLSVGDEIYVYDEANDRYKAWVLSADKTWVSSRTFKIDASGNQILVSEDPHDAKVPRGSAIWLRRSDVSKPIYLYGQYNKTPLSIEIEANKAQMVAPPTTQDVTLETFASTTEAPVLDTEDEQTGNTAQFGDQIFRPSDDGKPVMYIHKNGHWGYYEQVKSTKFGKTVITPTWRNADKVVIKAGTGVWYISHGGNPKVNWPAPVAPSAANAE